MHQPALEMPCVGKPVRHEGRVVGLPPHYDGRLARKSVGKHPGARLVARVAAVPTAPLLADREQSGSVVPAPSIGMAANVATEEGVSVLERLRKGRVTLITSPQELQAVLDEHKEAVVVLKCKAKTCRPCMAFRKPYLHIAEDHSEAVFLEIFGDASTENRRMMLDFNVKATPTFRIFKANECVNQVVGINKEKLSSAVRAAQIGYSDEA